MNPTGEAFKIHEVRFHVETTSEYVTGAVVGCKMGLGTIAITNNFVPLWNFGKVISRDQDSNLEFSWRLQHPIHVPAGGILSATFQHFGLVSATVTARVTYFASAIDSLPRRVFLPYVSTYIGKAFPYEDADSDTSRETDLANPFDSDLLISRLIGRFNVFSAAGRSNISQTGSQLLRTRISLSNGDALVRTGTPFSQIFGQEGRAWEQRNTVLKPKQYFQVFVDKEATDDTATGSTIQPYVSLVGYRELEMQE